MGGYPASPQCWETWARSFWHGAIESFAAVERRPPDRCRRLGRPRAPQRLCLSDSGLLVDARKLGGVEVVSFKAGNDVEMNVEDVLIAGGVVVLANRNAVGGERLLRCSGCC